MRKGQNGARKLKLSVDRVVQLKEAKERDRFLK